MARNAIVLGPPSVGKGLTGNQFEKIYGDIVHPICVGELIRKRMSVDDAFRNKNYELTTNGYLISDEEVIPMVGTKWLKTRKMSPELIYWDGHFRTKRQVDDAHRKKMYIKEETICFILTADEKTCQKREDHGLQTGHRSGRTDNKSLSRRYAIYMENISSVVESFRLNGIKIFNVDANQLLDLVASYVIQTTHKEFDLSSVIQSQTKKPSPYAIFLGLSAA